MNLKYILFFLVLLASACQSNSTVNPEKHFSVTDSYNRTITLQKHPKRVISASPAITEIMFALGLGDKLVGRTDFCMFPPEAHKIASVGGLVDPSIETMVSLDPDLIIASAHFQKETVEQLEHLKTNIIVLVSQNSFQGAYETISRLSSIFNVAQRGDSIIASMKKKVLEVQSKVAKITARPSVYIVINYGKTGDYTAGGDTFISDMISMAGGINAARDTKGWAYSLEKLVENDPDIIIIRPGEKEQFCKTKNYRNLKAVRTGKVFEVDNDLFDLTGPRLADGLDTLFRIFHQPAQ